MKTRPKRSRDKLSATLRHAEKLGRLDGCEVQIRLLERSGGIKDLAERVAVFAAVEKGSARTHKRTGKGSRLPLVDAATAVFAALGHPQRARMLYTLLAGPATYRTIQKVTKLKAGPLYHHVNQLRLAGLIAPRRRDLYELTRGGRNLVLLAVAGGPLLKDRRRRPLG